jgi:hypothetical protein
MLVYRVIKKVCVHLMIFLWGAMKNLVYSNLPHTIDEWKRDISGVPWIFFSGGWGSTNSVEDRGQGERGSGGGSPLLRGSAQFANE